MKKFSSCAVCFLLMQKVLWSRMYSLPVVKWMCSGVEFGDRILKSAAQKGAVMDSGPAPTMSPLAVFHLCAALTNTNLNEDGV